MDNGLLFPYRCYGGKGGTRKGRLSMPIGHGVSLTIDDAGAGKSTPDIIVEGKGKKERDLRKLAGDLGISDSVIFLKDERHIFAALPKDCSKIKIVLKRS